MSTLANFEEILFCKKYMYLLGCTLFDVSLEILHPYRDAVFLYCEYSMYD